MSIPDETNDFEDLLALTNDDEAAELSEVAPDEAPVQPAPVQEQPQPAEKPKRTRAPRKPKDAPEQTAEQKRIQELEAQLAAMDEAEEAEDEPELTPEQKRIQELEAQLAQRAALEAAGVAVKYRESKGEGEEVVFHFAESGLSAFGQIWEKGQLIRIRRDSPEWIRTQDRFGVSWIEKYLDNIDAQIAKWGQIMISRGEYRWRVGEEFDVDVARADVRRNGRVPVASVI